MWRDESVTYQVAHRSVPEIWGLLHHFDAVHGAYYFLMHALFAVWDGGLWTMRLPSAVAMSVCAGLVAITGMRLVGRRVGVLAGLSCTLIPVVQMYAQEGRSYALVAAFVALSTYLLVRAVERPGRGVWAGYAAALLCAVYLHEFAVLCLLAHGVTVLAAPVPARVRRAWAAAAAVVAVAALPLVAISLGQSGQVSWIGMPSGRDWLVIGAVTVIGLTGARAAASGQARGSVTLPRLALPLLLLPTAALLLVSLHDPVYLDRYVLYSNIGLALLVAAGIDALARKLSHTGIRGRTVPEGFAAGAICALIVAALLPVTLQMRTPESRKDDVTAIAETVRRMSAGGDAVLYMPARRREWAMSYEDDYRGLRDIALRESPVRSETLQGTEEPAAVIRQRMLAGTRIVALMDPEGQPLDPYPQEAVKRTTLSRAFTECARAQVKGAQVVLYARPGHCGS
ncbi:glycosyltransferase family 39 protein [Streptomyces dysideae]|nr:glycosyltransferase family 39 protein [Streptomyces dysideae]